MSSPFVIPFTRIKDSVLGRRYTLSLVFVDDRFSRRLNYIYRKKNKSSNVLSFPLSEESGEMFIDLVTAFREAEDFNLTFPDFVGRLFIHGLLHLKGMPHGTTMEKREKLFYKRFIRPSYGQTPRRGYRYRHLRDKGHYRRSRR